MQLTTSRRLRGLTLLLGFFTSPIRAQQTVLYPAQGQTFNAIDAVNLEFDTTFSAVNITVFCIENVIGNYTFHAYDGNPLPAKGTAYLGPVNEALNIDWAASTKYPCHVLFVDPATKSNAFNSANFMMVSTTGVATTWSASSKLTSTSSTSSSTSSSTKSPTTTGAVATNTPVPASGETSSSSLSTGAAAGTGVGVGVAAIGAAGLLFFCLQRRRRRRSASEKATHPTSGSPHTNMANTGPGQTYGHHPQPGYAQGGHFHAASSATAADQDSPQYPGYGQHPSSAVQQDYKSYAYGGKQQQQQQQPIHESGGTQVASELPGHQGRYELS